MIFISSTSQHCEFTQATPEKARKHAMLCSDSASWPLTEQARCGRCLTMPWNAMISAADNFAQQLQMSPEVTFGDYLLCLNFYRKLDEKKFRLLLEKVKPFAASNSSDLVTLLDWMNQNGLAGDVVKWIDKLPAAQLSSAPMSIAVA